MKWLSPLVCRRHCVLNGFTSQEPVTSGSQSCFRERKEACSQVPLLTFVWNKCLPLPQRENENVVKIESKCASLPFWFFRLHHSCIPFLVLGRSLLHVTFQEYLPSASSCCASHQFMVPKLQPLNLQCCVNCWKCVRNMAFRRWFGTSEIISCRGPYFITLESHAWIPQMLQALGNGMYMRDSASTFCERLWLLILFSFFLLREPFFWRLNFLWGGHNINAQSSFSEALDFVLSCVLWDYGKGMHLLELRVEGTGWSLSSRLVSSSAQGGVDSVTPPVTCCGSLAVFTRRDGPKRVKIMLRRRVEFIEILCLVCHGTGVFSFSWLECDNSAAWEAEYQGINLGENVQICWVIYEGVGIYNKILNIDFRRVW